MCVETIHSFRLSKKKVWEGLEGRRGGSTEEVGYQHSVIKEDGMRGGKGSERREREG